MVIKEIGCAGVVVGGVPDEIGASAPRDDGCSVADDVADVGDGMDGNGGASHAPIVAVDAFGCGKAL
jgi:hypothetical protein